MLLLLFLCQERWQIFKNRCRITAKNSRILLQQDQAQMKSCSAARFIDLT